MSYEIEAHIAKKYEIKKRLGKGPHQGDMPRSWLRDTDIQNGDALFCFIVAYGIVWKAVDRRTGEVVAVKKIFDAFRNQTDAQRTFREIMFLQEFGDHPNVIKLHNVIKAENDKDIYLVFEYMETDLHNVIKRGSILKEVHKRYVMYQLFKSMKYLHSGNVIHRDLKPSNILLDSDCIVKLCDFGLARSLIQIGMDEQGDPNLTEYVATRWYRAPEILLASHKYTKGVDMWSLGCILGELLLGKPLFPGSSTLNQIERIMSIIPSPTTADIDSLGSQYGSSILEKAVRRPSKSLEFMMSDMPLEGVDLLRRLLQFNPDKRITAVAALGHPFVNRFHNSADEISLNFDVVPPLSDDVQLTVDQYRSKLYEMIMQKKAERRQRRRAAVHNLSNNHPSHRAMSEPGSSHHDNGHEHAPHERPPTGFSPAYGQVDSQSHHHHQRQHAPRTADDQDQHVAQHRSSFAACTANGRVDESSNVHGCPRVRSHKMVHRPLGVENIHSTDHINGNGRHTSAPIAARGYSRQSIGFGRTFYPVVTRDDHNRNGNAVSSCRMIPGHCPISRPVFGRRQYNNATNNPSTGAPKITFGSYAQAYGTIGSNYLASIHGHKS